MREDMKRGGTSEAGFALIMAILALLLLSFLGLTLAATTSTELKIANNYRWERQAYYNAEAGIEAGKSLLKGMDWALILPAARSAPNNWTIGTVAPSAGTVPPWQDPHATDQWGNQVRRFEGMACDREGGGAGYGVVLDDGSAQAPFQYVTTVFGQNVNGAFTLWVRRPAVIVPTSINATTTRDTVVWTDYPDNNTLILTSEGVAPFRGATLSSAYARASMSRVVLQTVVARTPAQRKCDKNSGQSAGDAAGSGLASCAPLVDPNDPTLQGQGFLGSGLNLGGANVQGGAASQGRGTGAQNNGGSTR